MKKLVSGAVTSEATFLHHDGLGSVRAVTNAAGVKSETALYRPYGEQSEQVWTALLNEAKGFIGERYDADAGLQYLNARYYDPRLGMFTQPDWWEVTQAGVGTNRYSYSFNDPVNGKDATGHAQCGSSNRGSGCNKSVDKLDKIRKDATEAAKDTRKLAARGRRVGFFEGLFSGEGRRLARIQRRVDKAFPNGYTAKDLNTLAEKYDKLAATIGPKGSGITVHDLDQLEADLRAQIGNNAMKIENAVAKMFGAGAFGAGGFLGRNQPLSSGRSAAGFAFRGANAMGLTGVGMKEILDDGPNADNYLSHEAAHVSGTDISDSPHYDAAGKVDKRAYYGGEYYKSLSTSELLNNADAISCSLVGC